MYGLWDSFSQELRTASYKMSNDNTIGEKQLRILVITHTNHDSQPRQHNNHVITPTRQDVSHEVEVVKVVEMVKKTKAAKEMEGKTKVPKPGINQTSKEWKKWKSSWTRYKRDTGITNQRYSVYSLWGCFTRKLEMMALNDMLHKDLDLDEDEERFLKRVRKLAVSTPQYYAKEGFAETTNETAPHARGNITEPEKETAEFLAPEKPSSVKALHKTVPSNFFEAIAEILHEQSSTLSPLQNKKSSSSSPP